ncbi:MAG TPA: hypothetical protein VLA59_08850 [Patescibacteria group bacterium]|nr:hypothetical protein [Patescibacteria group bacterium]
MSREERRNYQRMMKNMERGPALPPAARARAERNAQRRARRAQPEAAGALSRRFWIRTLLIATVLGFIAFSLQWSNGMPFALYAGLAVAFVVLLLIVGFRLLQRRTGAS